MNYKLLLLIVLLAFLIRLHPLLMDALVCPDPNFHLRMAELWVESGGKPLYDPLSMQGRYYSYPPLYHLTYAALSIFSALPLSLLIQLFPAVYGVIAIVLVFAFANRLFGERVALFASFALAVMPMHIIRTWAYARTDGLAMLLVFAVICLLYRKSFATAAILSVVLVLLHPLSTFYLLTFMILWAVVFVIRREEIAARSFAIIILLAFAVFLLWLFSQHYPFQQYVSFTSFESSELSNLSLIGIFSFFTFSWLFVVIALFKLRSQLFLKTWFAFSLLYAAIGIRLAIFLSFPAAILAGFGMDFIAAKVRPYRLVFFFLVIVLALMAVVPRLQAVQKHLSDGERSAMLWLNENSPPDSTIAARWDVGHPLTRFAGRTVVVDGYFEFAPTLEARNASVSTLIESSDCSKIGDEVKRWHINYFFVPDESLKAQSFMNGILEATDCPVMSSVFESDASRIFSYSPVPQILQ